MKTKTSLNIFTGLGAFTMAVSAAWWGVVYHFVSQQNGESMWGSVACMYSLSAECNFLRAMGWLRGMNPYEPMLFWLGVSVLLMSLLLKRTLEGQKRAPT
jgi:hypothetical protein